MHAIHTMYLTPCNDCMLLTLCVFKTVIIVMIASFKLTFCMLQIFHISALHCQCLQLIILVMWFWKDFNWKLPYVRQTGRKNIKELDEDLQCILLSRARLLEEKDSVFTICFHREQLFGDVFERKADNLQHFEISSP